MDCIIPEYVLRENDYRNMFINCSISITFESKHELEPCVEYVPTDTFDWDKDMKKAYQI